MVITFCGHADFFETEEHERNLLAFLEKTVRDHPAEMYLGGYGGFDQFAYLCCRKYKETHPNIRLVLVSPYLTTGTRSSEYRQAAYDSVIYPEIEDKPPRVAIVYRNRYMVERADHVIAYVSHAWGGAYKTYRYAQRKGKEIWNLADFDR